MRIRSFDQDKAILYLVATPIGNLADISLRAIDILKSVDKIYAEDTRNSKVLLDYYSIKNVYESYHEFSQEKTSKIIEELKNGMKIAIISDAGLPVISDPGFKLVREARDLGIAVSTIPGASAGISALIASGFVAMPYTFFGFLDSKESKRIIELNSLKFINHTLVFYEAPHRIFDTLKNMLDIFGDRNICIARELTKTYEEYISGKISEIINMDSIKGEIVLIVEGCKEEVDNSDPFKQIDELISLGYKPNEAIKEVSRMHNIDRKELYKNYIDYKNQR